VRELVCVKKEEFASFSREQKLAFWINLLIAQQLVIDVERFSTMARLSVIPPLCPLSVSAGDFSHTAELVDRAEKQTLRWIDEQGLDEPGVPARLRPHQHGAVTAG
jgi:NTE family protein